MTATEQKVLPASTFSYQVECYKCGTLHLPIEITIPEGEKKTTLAFDCVRCEKTNDLIIYRDKVKQ